MRGGLPIDWSNFVNEESGLFLVRLLFALLFSGLIGFERELKNHSAGFRTHILVGVGACLMMLLSLYGFKDYISSHEHIRFDPSRIPSYVISGIGFLGAGTIIVNGITIRGLTTAASIWTVAGIGLVVGAGMYDVAFLSTMIVLLALIFLNKIEKKKFKEPKRNYLTIAVKPDADLGEIFAVLAQSDIKIKKMNIKTKEESNRTIHFELEKSKNHDIINFVSELSKTEAVRKIDHSF